MKRLVCRIVGHTPMFRYSAPYIVCARCLAPWEYRGGAR